MPGAAAAGSLLRGGSAKRAPRVSRSATPRATPRRALEPFRSEQRRESGEASSASARRRPSLASSLGPAAGVRRPLALGKPGETRERRGGGSNQGLQGHEPRGAPLTLGDIAGYEGARAPARALPVADVLRDLEDGYVGASAAVPHPPPPVLRTDRTHRVPRPILIGHAASPTPY